MQLTPALPVPLWTRFEDACPTIGVIIAIMVIKAIIRYIWRLMLVGSDVRGGGKQTNQTNRAAWR